MKTIFGGWLVGWLLLCLHTTASGQWVLPDTNFPAGDGPDFIVRTLVLQPDGRLLIGGLFTNVDGVSSPRFARLNSDGKLDSSFQTQVGGEPTHFDLLRDQRLLISGSFTNVGAAARPGLAILHPDGSLDESFAPPALTGPNSQLNGLLAPGPSVMIAGSFTNLGGIAQNHIARLLSSGAVDTSFNSPFDATNTITLLAVQPDGKALISGGFSNLAGVSVTNLLRLNTDGSIDATFQSGLKPNEQVFKAWLQPDGKLLTLTRLAASFPSWLSRLVRLDTNGAVDSAFSPSFQFPGFPFNANISSLTLQPDGKIVLGGNFLRVDGVSRASIARLQPDGSLDYCFEARLSADLSPYAVVAAPDGGIVAGGAFGGLPGREYPFLVKLMPPPGCDPGVIQLGVSNLLSRSDAHDLVVPLIRTGSADRDDTVDFTTLDGSAVSGRDYTAVSGTIHFAPGQRSQSIPVPLILGAATNGALSFQIQLTKAGAGASLGALTNALATLIAARPGTAGSPDTNYLVQFDGQVRIILPQTNGACYIIGDFTNVDAQLNPNLARLLSDGSRDPGFNRTQPVDGTVLSAALDSVGRVLIAGYFQHIDSVWRPGLARFQTDGSLDSSFGPFDGWTNAFGQSAQIRAVCVLPDDSIVCGGSVPGTNYSGNDVLLKLSPTGQFDASFTNVLPQFVTVGSLSSLPGGDFFVIGHGLGNSLVRLHPDGRYNFNFLAPADHQFSYYSGTGLGLLADGRVAVGGMADAFFGLPNQPPLWRLNPDGSLDPGFSLAPAFGAWGSLEFVNSSSVSFDGRVLVAGSFANGPYAGLARVLADGSLDLSFDSGKGFAARPASSVSLNTLASLSQGGWLLGGDFGSYDGFTQSYLVKILPEQLTRPLTFQFALTNLTISESNGLFTVEVVRTGDASTDASVVLSTVDGTAIAGQDYILLSTNLHFAAGEWSKTVSVASLDDRRVEPTEQFSLQLSDPAGGFTVGHNALLTVQIQDNDAGVQFVSDQFNAAQEDGYAQVGLRWAGVLTNGLTATVNISPNTGRAADLGLTSAVVTYTGGTTNWFRIPITQSPSPQGVRQFSLQLSTSSNLFPGPQTNAVLSLTDHNFATTPARGVAGVVEAMAHSSNGGVYLGGDFAGVDGVSLKRIARLRPDGEVDTSFNPEGGPDSDVTAIAEQADGKVLIAGPFANVNGVPRAGLARLNPSGSLDAVFDPGSGIRNTNGLPFIRVLLPQPDGTLWVAGAFTHFNNHYDRLLAHVLTDGGVDFGYEPPFTLGGFALRGGNPSVIYSLLQQPDGKLLAGGLMYFGSGLSLVQANVVRLTSAGQLDAAFTKLNPPPPNTTPLTVAPGPQGSVFAGTTVYSRTGSDTNWIALSLLQTNGLADPSFRVHGAPLMSFYESEARQLQVQTDGGILFSIAIYQSNPAILLSTYKPARAVIGRVLADGTWDSAFGLISCDLGEVIQSPGPFWFNNNLSQFFSQPLLPIPSAGFVQQPDGVLVLGGTFNLVNGELRRRLARLDPNGTLRGRLQLNLSPGQPQTPETLFLPPEIEAPYIIESSADLVHWTPWIQNDYPWTAIQLALPIDVPARFFRARVP